MKIRTDFVTNSSSSSFTVCNVRSKMLEDYMREHPVSAKIKESWLRHVETEATVYNNPQSLFSVICNKIDMDGNGGLSEAFELEEYQKSPAKMLEEVFLSFSKAIGDSGIEELIVFFRENEKAINKDLNAIIYQVEWFEGEAPEISAMTVDSGKIKKLVDLDFLECDFIEEKDADKYGMTDFSEAPQIYTSEAVRYLVDKYAALAAEFSGEEEDD